MSSDRSSSSGGDSDSSDTESSDSCSTSSSEIDQSDGSIVDYCDCNEATCDDYSDPFINATLQWTIAVPIGLGLCPWAVKSRNRNRLNIVKCDGDTPSEVAAVIEKQMCLLTCDTRQVPPLSTTLVVCPFVKEWIEYGAFEAFVHHTVKQFTNDEVLDKVTLVAFHPNFEKWYALPPEVGVGSHIQSHWGCTGRKSPGTAQAIIVETENRAFGLRKIKVRFIDDIDGRREQYVPIDWINFDHIIQNEQQRDLLPDNFMYQSPYPTIHIINNDDLGKLCVRDVSRVKRLNARRMARMGWDGLNSCFNNKNTKHKPHSGQINQT